MSTFFETFFICLVVTFGFLAYKFFSMAGYSPELTVTKSNPIFGTHTEVQNEDIFDNKVNYEITEEEIIFSDNEESHNITDSEEVLVLTKILNKLEGTSTISIILFVEITLNNSKQYFKLNDKFEKSFDFLLKTF